MDFSLRPGNARRSPAPGGNSSLASARGGGIQTQLSNLLAAAKQHEQLCARLEEGSRLLEEQLQGLRAEHEALRADHDDLRATLSRTGALLGKEPAGCAGANGVLAYSAAVQRHPVGAASGRGKPAAARTKSVEQRALASRGGGAAEGVERGARGHHGAPAGRATARGRSAETRGQPRGGRSPSPEEGPDARHGDQTYGRTSALRAYSQPADDDIIEWSEPEDDVADGQVGQTSLNGLLESVLEATGNSHEQRRELGALQQLLKSGPHALACWTGPGTPLSAAVRAGRSDVARLLLKAHADPNEKDPKGVSALHLAAFDGSVDLCKVLFFAHADVDQRDRHGQTPLFFAPSAGVCKVLIENSSDVRVLNRKGQSALHLAGRAGLCEVLEWLGHRVSRSLFELKDLHGATASDYLEQSGVPKPAASESPERGHSRPPSPRPPSPRRASPALRGRAEGPLTQALAQALATDEMQTRRPAAPKASIQAPRVVVTDVSKESSAVPSAPRSWSQPGQSLVPPPARRSRGSYTAPKPADERTHARTTAPAYAAPPNAQAPAAHVTGPRIVDLRKNPHGGSRKSVGSQEAAGERRSFSLFDVGGCAPPPRRAPPGAGHAAGGLTQDLALETAALEAAAALATAAVTAAAAGMQAVGMQGATASTAAPQAADEDFDHDADNWPVQVMDSTARHQMEQASEDVFLDGDIDDRIERGADGVEEAAERESPASPEVASRLFEDSSTDSVF